MLINLTFSESICLVNFHFENNLIVKLLTLSQIFEAWHYLQIVSDKSTFYVKYTISRIHTQTSIMCQV